MGQMQEFKPGEQFECQPSYYLETFREKARADLIMARQTISDAELMSTCRTPEDCASIFGADFGSDPHLE